MGFFDGIGSALLGGALDFFGGESANSTNSAIAQKQMDFQREMSNTAHQREVSDEYGDLVESAYGLWRLGYDGVKAAWPYWVKAVKEYPQNRKRLMKPWEK